MKLQIEGKNDMTKDYDRKMKLKNDSERIFREKCDDNNYTYMYIEQSKMTFSSKIWKDMTKRPDYILSIPSIGSIFIDVKAYSEHLFCEPMLSLMDKAVPKAFRLDVLEVFKYSMLQEETAMKVWFAIISVQGDTVTSDIHFLPLDRVTKFMTVTHYLDPEWTYIQVPIECSTDISKLTYHKCGSCKMKYCEKIYELLGLDDTLEKMDKSNLKDK